MVSSTLTPEQSRLDTITHIRQQAKADSINCFITYTVRTVGLMRNAADNIVALVVEGGAA